MTKADLMPDETLKRCRAHGKDERGTHHECHVRGRHEVHRCTEACRATWRDGEQPTKPRKEQA